ncbi:hypothetical protein ES703_110612 [subsurface metagenome]
MKNTAVIHDSQGALLAGKLPRVRFPALDCHARIRRHPAGYCQLTLQTGRLGSEVQIKSSRAALLEAPGDQFECYVGGNIMSLIYGIYQALIQAAVLIARVVGRAQLYLSRVLVLVRRVQGYSQSADLIASRDPDILINSDRP